ncbi:MAG TPA: hypothetical protein VE464_12120 [Streptosporangiaceae bacterium]|nr:hypothetical protein [Streptosporangiaceae bacterium]
MASKWGRISDGIRFGPQMLGGLGLRSRPYGAAPGSRWMAVGPIWIRLGSPSSWPGEDDAAKMIKPVEP